MSRPEVARHDAENINLEEINLWEKISSEYELFNELARDNRERAYELRRKLENYDSNDLRDRIMKILGSIEDTELGDNLLQVYESIPRLLEQETDRKNKLSDLFNVDNYPARDLLSAGSDLVSSLMEDLVARRVDENGDGGRPSIHFQGELPYRFMTANHTAIQDGTLQASVTTSLESAEQFNRSLLRIETIIEQIEARDSLKQGIQQVQQIDEYEDYLEMNNSSQ